MKPPARRPGSSHEGIDWYGVLGPKLAGLDEPQLEQLNQTIGRHSPRCLRLNYESDENRLPFAVQQVPWYRDGRWVVDSTIRPGAFLHHAAGDYYIQDAASLLALSACNIKPNEAVCDVCAAPGGKSTGLLQQLNHTGYLVANETIKSRLNVLHQALERTGLGNYVTTSLDVDELAELVPYSFDCVLVDAPCSGQSMVGSDRQSMAAFSEHQIQHSAARQRRILQSASHLAKQGGRLVYSTCTFSIAENEHVIEQFLSSNRGWQPISYAHLKPWETSLLPGCYRLWPHRDGCDGAFVATLVRVEGSSVDSSRFSLKAASSTPGAAKPRGTRSKSRAKRLLPWLGRLAQLDFLDSQQSEIVGYRLWQSDDRLLLINDQIPAQILQLVYSAPTIARLKNGRIEPEYSSAVLLKPKLSTSEVIELSSQQALRYISGESIRLEEPEQFQGWCRVDWLGRQLGWGKVLDRKLKNHLPKSMRQSNLIDG